jgi:hypothetical protein
MGFRTVVIQTIRQLLIIHAKLTDGVINETPAERNVDDLCRSIIDPHG